jgi:hypothetical protein
MGECQRLQFCFCGLKQIQNVIRLFVMEASYNRNLKSQEIFLSVFFNLSEPSAVADGFSLAKNS